MFLYLCRLLKALGFSIKPELPFAYLLNYLKSLAASPQLAAAGHPLDLSSPRECVVS